MSSPHKCDQVVWCRAFNVVVAAFSPDISSFVVGYFPWYLSSKEQFPFVQNFRDSWAPFFHNTFRGSSTPREPLHVCYYLPLFSIYRSHSLSNISTILGLYMSSSTAHDPMILLGLFIITIIIIIIIIIIICRGDRPRSPYLCTYWASRPNPRMLGNLKTSKHFHKDSY